jgi:hypothetical protein
MSIDLIGQTLQCLDFITNVAGRNCQYQVDPPGRLNNQVISGCPVILIQPALGSLLGADLSPHLRMYGSYPRCGSGAAIPAHETVCNLRVNAVFVQICIIGEMLSQAGDIYRIADDGSNLPCGQNPFETLWKETIQPFFILSQGFVRNLIHNSTVFAYDLLQITHLQLG